MKVRFLNVIMVLCFALVLQPAKAADRVRVGVIPVMGSAPFFVANGEGWFKEAGLDLDVKLFESGPVAIQAAVSGNVDIYIAGVTPAVLARTKGIDLRIVAATAINENVLASGSKLRAFFKPGVTPAQAFKAFHTATNRPAKIATQPPGSVPAANLQYWLREVAHVDLADVEVVSIGIDATQQALLAGAVDAAIVREPTLTILQQRDPSITLLATGSELFPGQPGTIVAVSKAFADKHGDSVQLLVNNIVKAVALLQKDPDRAAPHIEAALSKGIVDGAIFRKALSSPAVQFVTDPESIRDATKAMLDFQVKLGVLEATPSLEGAFDRSYYLKAIGQK